MMPGAGLIPGITGIMPLDLMMSEYTLCRSGMRVETLSVSRIFA